MPEDREICEALLAAARRRGDGGAPLSALITAVSRHFLGAPYEAGTLERKGPEQLVVNLRAFDCVTLVESVLALAGLIGAGRTGFADFTAALTRIRYRGGRLNGYPSRLHYFTDWLHDNGRKGIVRDITAEIGGIALRKGFRSLTDRRGEQPALADAATFRRMRIVEAACSRRTFHCIPKETFREAANRIEEGDIIAITTDADGIDVSHTGIALRVHRSLRLLHASSRAGKVVLSDTTLHSYLQARRSRTGIIVGRPIPGDVPIRGLTEKDLCR